MIHSTKRFQLILPSDLKEFIMLAFSIFLRVVNSFVVVALFYILTSTPQKYALLCAACIKAFAMKNFTKRFHSSEREGESQSNNMVESTLSVDLPHKEKDESAGCSTVRSWDSKPSSREKEYVNPMSDSVRERCIKLIDAVKWEENEEENEEENGKEMRDIEIRAALLHLLADIMKEMNDKDLIARFEGKCRFKYSFDLEDIKLYFTAKERPFYNPLEKDDKHFFCEYRHPEIVSKVRKRIEVYLNDKNTLPYSVLLQTAFAGKSRMVYELAKTVPTIYINLVKEFSYPPQTEESVFFFKGLRDQNYWSRYEHLKRCLLLAIERLSGCIITLREEVLGSEILEGVWQAQVSGETSFLSKDMLESNRQAREEVWSELYEVSNMKSEKVKLKVLLVIDEAKFIGPHQRQEELFYDFMLVTDELRDRGMFTLFVNTTSESTASIVAGKVSGGELHNTNVNPPIYCFNTFDVIVKDQNVSTREVAHKDKLLSMGRPMWYGLRKCEYADVVELAKRKLVDSTDTINGELASMMCLYAIPLQDTMELARSLLEYNMALPAYIASNRKLFKVYYESEPVLAHAAHLAREKDSFVDLLDLLKKFMLNDQVSTDNRVEMVARILIMWLVTERHSELYHSTIRGLNLLGVDDFLQSMHVSTELAIPNGMVHFSHWTQIDCKMCPHVMLKCFTRGTAIAYCGSRPVVDMVIPVFIDTEENQTLIENLNLEYSRLSQSEPLEAHIEKAIAQCFSFVAIQLKNNVGKSFFEEHIEFFESFSAHPGVVINIKMSGEEKADDVSELSKNHTYIYRESVEAWHLGRDETERLKNQVDYFMASGPKTDSKEILDEQEEYFKHCKLFY